MFPTLSYLVRWLTGWNLYLPVPTFGFCMALAFWAAYAIFTLELRRKQRLAAIPSDSRLTHPAAPGIRPIPSDLRTVPPTGAIPPGIPVGRLMDRLLLWCGLIGFAGALLLAKLEDGYGLWHHPWRWLIRYQGLNYYGGLIFGAITYLYILRRRGIPLAVAADIGSPGMMLAYAIGRMGCHLAGDGDWGIVVRSPKPSWLSWAPDWVWAVHYPHNVLRQGVPIPDCRLDYCMVLPESVFPTALYESVVGGLLFFLLWGLRRRLNAPGLLFSIYALLIGLERFLIEYIRITPRHLFLGWTLSQAQLISLGFIALGVAGISYILTTSAKKAYFYP
jgi:phosphatidylglycerol---prolipoprotein diacylglyceryl transferase